MTLSLLRLPQFAANVCCGKYQETCAFKCYCQSYSGWNNSHKNIKYMNKPEMQNIFFKVCVKVMGLGLHVLPWKQQLIKQSQLKVCILIYFGAFNNGQEGIANLEWTWTEHSQNHGNFKHLQDHDNRANYICQWRPSDTVKK